MRAVWGACAFLCVLIACTVADDSFEIWLDPPGSPQYIARKPAWYDTILTAANTSFMSGDTTIQVNMAQHGAIHLFADPAFQNGYDDVIRAWSGDKASQWTGTIDSCGWPAASAQSASPSLQYQKRVVPLYENFSRGLSPESFYVNLQKGCCAKTPAGDYSDNINIVMDTVNGVTKPVLALTALSADDTATCPGANCHKTVTSTGSVVSAGLYASGRYEVIAKVANASGLTWALWTFHFESHFPVDCSLYTCYCQDVPSSQRLPDFCSTATGCLYPNTCDNDTTDWMPNPPPPTPMMSPGQCGANHASVGPDPQYLQNASFAGWETQTNHEIDIEMPANCEGCTNVCGKPSDIPGAFTCIGDYSTANFNNYLFTQNSGTGPAYSNMCVKASNADGSPRLLMADGQYHNYTFVWHTGDGKGNNKSVDFFIDSTYMGSNNVFVPTRGSRLNIAHWFDATSKNKLWNGWPDDWSGGFPGDGKVYSQTTLISEVNITPFNEPGDVMYPSITDLPDGCATPYFQKYSDVCHPSWVAFQVNPKET